RSGSIRWLRGDSHARPYRRAGASMGNRRLRAGAPRSGVSSGAEQRIDATHSERDWRGAAGRGYFLASSVPRHWTSLAAGGAGIVAGSGIFRRRESAHARGVAAHTAVFSTRTRSAPLCGDAGIGSRAAEEFGMAETF